MKEIIIKVWQTEQGCEHEWSYEFPGTGKEFCEVCGATRKTGEPGPTGGYMYEVYEDADMLARGLDGLAGGLCTGTLADALDMAVIEAKTLISPSTK